MGEALTVNWWVLILSLLLLWSRTVKFVRHRIPVGPAAQEAIGGAEEPRKGGGKVLRELDEGVTRLLEKVAEIGRRPDSRSEPRPTSGQFLSHWEAWQREWAYRRRKMILFAAWNLARAVVGTWLLVGWAFAWDSTGSTGSVGSERALHGIQLSLLGIGLLLQTIQYRKEVIFAVPVFYICGMSLILSGWATAGFAIVVALLFTAGLKDLRSFLPAMAVAMAGFGLVVDWNLLVLGNIALILLVIGLTLFFPRPVIFYIAPR